MLSALVGGAVVNDPGTPWTLGHAPLELEGDRFAARVVELLGRPFELLAEQQEP